MCSAKSNTVHVLNYQNSRSEKSVKIIRLYLVAARAASPELEMACIEDIIAVQL